MFGRCGPVSGLSPGTIEVLELPVFGLQGLWDVLADTEVYSLPGACGAVDIGQGLWVEGAHRRSSLFWNIDAIPTTKANATIFLGGLEQFQ